MNLRKPRFGNLDGIEAHPDPFLSVVLPSFGREYLGSDCKDALENCFIGPNDGEENG